MAEIIRMPRLSDTMEEGNIVSWLKKVGDAVKAGDVLAEVETDKATMELESFFDGFLLHIGQASGPVPVDGIIAVIGKKDEDVATILASAGSKIETTKIESAPTPASNQIVQSEMSTTTHPVVTHQVPVVENTSDSRVKASPLAKTIAQDKGIALENVQGSGDNGRIVKRDVESFTPQKSSTTPAPTPIQSNDSFNYGDVSVSQMRKVIAKRLGESKFSAPHFYLTIEVNMDQASIARTSINAGGVYKVSFNDIVIKACATALRKHPAINSSWFGDKITFHRDINIGVAVAVEDGLLVPVIHNADQKTLSYINNEVKELAGKAKSKKLAPTEMTGNTFTISNLGMFDIEEFTAIINPPDACILAVGSIIKKPIVKDESIVIGNMMRLTLSCDHRVVDGATGAQFLQTLKAMLENPLLMIV
jgi:pyruvate dehydrogenase E2 component (dihydrolipoamide acetyltransferase)